MRGIEVVLLVLILWETLAVAAEASNLFSSDTPEATRPRETPRNIKRWKPRFDFGVTARTIRLDNVPEILLHSIQGVMYGV